MNQKIELCKTIGGDETKKETIKFFEINKMNVISMKWFNTIKLPHYLHIHKSVWCM